VIETLRPGRGRARRACRRAGHRPRQGRLRAVLRLPRQNQARFGDALHCLLIAPEVRGPNGTPLGTSAPTTRPGEWRTSSTSCPICSTSPPDAVLRCRRAGALSDLDRDGPGVQGGQRALLVLPPRGRAPDLHRAGRLAQGGGRHGPPLARHDSARVTYVRDPVIDSLAYGIRHDRACWLLQITTVVRAAEPSISPTTVRGDRRAHPQRRRKGPTRSPGSRTSARRPGPCRWAPGPSSTAC